MFLCLSGIAGLLASAHPPLFPASGPATGSFNGRHLKSNFLAILAVVWAAPGQRNERGDSVEARYFNNCVYAMNLARFVEIARIPNKPDEVALYGQRLADLKQKIHATYFNPATHFYRGGTHVQLAFALLAGPPPENLRPAVSETLWKLGGFLPNHP